MKKLFILVLILVLAACTQPGTNPDPNPDPDPEPSAFNFERTWFKERAFNDRDGEYAILIRLSELENAQVVIYLHDDEDLLEGGIFTPETITLSEDAEELVITFEGTRGDLDYYILALHATATDSVISASIYRYSATDELVFSREGFTMSERSDDFVP